MGTEIALDRHVPEAHEGTLEPNYFCRAWNGKRNKYCKQKAGHNTDHGGVGRCSWHDLGSRTKTHGRYGKHVGPKLAKHLEIIQNEGGDRTDLTQEVDTFRAITAYVLENFDALIDALMAWNDAEDTEALMNERRARPQRIPDIKDVGKMIKDAADLADKIHAQAHRDSIPKKDFFRLQDAQADVVAAKLRGIAHIIGDDAVSDMIAAISDGWSEIRL